MPKRGIGHSQTTKGKKVSVLLTSGRILQGRFVEKNDRHLIIEGHKRIPWKRIRNMSSAAARSR